MTNLICDHALPYCVDFECRHAVPHGRGEPSLNGLVMGDCTDERNEIVCCVPTGEPVRVVCRPDVREGTA
jgi:hypothetical protein